MGSGLEVWGLGLLASGPWEEILKNANVGNMAWSFSQAICKPASSIGAQGLRPGAQTGLLKVYPVFPHAYNLQVFHPERSDGTHQRVGKQGYRSSFGRQPILRQKFCWTR